MIKQLSLLAIFAHPDDEAFGTGGSIACSACEGVRVDLVCATRGEVGSLELSPHAVWTRQPFPQASGARSQEVDEPRILLVSLARA